MTTEEKIAVVRAMTPVGTMNLDDETVTSYLSAAEEAVINRLYPYRDNMEMPEKYTFVQIRICVYNINKRGAEGETKHIEVGTERDFASADIPDDLLSELVPMCGVPM